MYLFFHIQALNKALPPTRMHTCLEVLLVLELLELTQTPYGAQKPLLWVKMGAHEVRKSYTHTPQLNHRRL
jgi:hypothetical protein